jgi:hypothetical protein
MLFANNVFSFINMRFHLALTTLPHTQVGMHLVFNIVNCQTIQFGLANANIGDGAMGSNQIFEVGLWCIVEIHHQIVYGDGISEIIVLNI